MATTHPVQSVLFDHPAPSTAGAPDYHHCYDAPTQEVDGLEFYNSAYDLNDVHQRPSPALLSSFAAAPPLAHVGISANVDSFWSAFGAGGFADEPPLLEELGISFEHIRTKSLAVLNPVGGKVPLAILNDGDVAGPLLYLFVFGVFLMLSGKVHFGYIYGVGLLGQLTILLLLNMMSEGGIDGSRTASVLGYCLLPMVILSGVRIVLPLAGATGFVWTVLAIGWCTHASTDMFTTMLQMQSQRFLVAYPLALFYASFALMAVY